MADAAKKPKTDIPAWALVFESVGWLIRAAGVIPGLLALVSLRKFSDGLLLVIPAVIVAVSLALFFGGIPIAIARSAWIGGSPSRWRLWAKTLMLSGGILCISIPAFVYWTAYVAVPVGVSLGTDQAAPAAVSPFDPRFLTPTLLFGGPSFILGLCLIIPALIWGRRKPLPSIPDVFS